MSNTWTTLPKMGGQSLDLLQSKLLTTETLPWTIVGTRAQLIELW